MMMYKRLTINAISFLVVLITSCAVAPEAELPDGSQTAKPDYVYRIGPEDVLSISVWKNPELSATVSVRPDGMISLPLLNDVQAADHTPEELRTVLKDRLKEYVNNVELSVIVKEIHSQKISILGEVNSPARYEFNSRLTVLDAIALAGGLTPFAARNRIVVIRKLDDAPQRMPFNYDTASTSNGAVGNYEIQPGDIVMVPKTLF